MAALAIQAHGLGKRYRLGETGYATLREKLAGIGRRASPSPREEIWAIRDLELEIAEGDVVGIIGRNGAGKTTFLKTVAGIVRPTTGVVRVRGRVGALLEVGTGFHPELTGRENVFLNGVVLGMSRREVRRRFDEIVEFAGVERFLDTPLKRYSTGMHLRLAFAVAAHIDPDVLIVDEVLAVGDAEFQRRCLGRMSEFAGEGRTVVFVSHDSGAVARLCPRAIWLEDGRVRDQGPTLAMLDLYLASTEARSAAAVMPTLAGGPIRDVSLAVLDVEGNLTETVQRDQQFTILLRFTSAERVHGLDAALYLIDENGIRLVNENLSDDPGARRLDGPPGEREVTLVVPPVLASGRYLVGTWIGSSHDTFVSGEALAVTLMPTPFDQRTARHGLVRPTVVWNVRAPQ